MSASAPGVIKSDNDSNPKEHENSLLPGHTYSIV